MLTEAGKCKQGMGKQVLGNVELTGVTAIPGA